MPREDLAHRLQLAGAKAKLRRLPAADDHTLSLDDDVRVRPAAVVGVDGVDEAMTGSSYGLVQSRRDRGVQLCGIARCRGRYAKDHVYGLALVQAFVDVQRAALLGRQLPRGGG